MLHAATASRIRKPVGIDLGTTNSVIALLDATGSNLLTGRDEQGKFIFPSLVGHDAATNQLVSGRAAQALVSHPASSTLPLSSVKRFMGLDRRFDVGPKSLTPAVRTDHGSARGLPAPGDGHVDARPAWRVP